MKCNIFIIKEQKNSNYMGEFLIFWRKMEKMGNVAQKRVKEFHYYIQNPKKTARYIKLTARNDLMKHTDAV